MGVNYANAMFLNTILQLSPRKISRRCRQRYSDAAISCDLKMDP